jgi:uncharacterized protein DUF5676
MKLYIWAFGLSVGVVVAAAFTVCAFFVAVAPEATAAVIGYLLHINFAGLSRSITWASYFAGVVAIAVWTGLWAAAAAQIYNRFVSK